MQKFLSRAVSALAVGLVFGACQDAMEPVALEANAGNGKNARCVGLLTGTFANVVVPRGKECTLVDSKVRGNVKALQDSRLFMENDIVRGNVEGDKARAVQVISSTVHGNIHIIEAHDEEFLSTAVVFSDLPNGNIQIEKGRAPFGDWTVFDNRLDKGNIKIEENRSVFEGFTANNTAAQDVQVFKNTQELIVVADNVIGENLQCKENSEPFVGQPNVVGGNVEDQCAGSGTTATISARARPNVSEFPLRRQTD